MRLATVSLLLAAGLATAGAQGTTADQINRAKALYETFDVEGARPILLNIISPNYLQPVSPSERVEAYKYLGASYALLGHTDTAATYFVAALDFYPFTDLDPRVFGATEQAAFAVAKERIFKIGLYQIDPKIVNPQLDTSAYNFRVITTHQGNLRVELANRAGTITDTLYQGTSNGERRITWRGVRSSTGQLLPPDIYQIRAIGSTARQQAAQEVRDIQFFRVEHHFDALEDTLAAFGGSDTLVTQIPAIAPWYDLAKGLFVGTLAAVGLPALALDNNVRGSRTHALAAGAVIISSGTASLLFRRSNRDISANVRENQRRKDARRTFNERVVARNADRLARRLIIVTPAAGFTQ